MDFQITVQNINEKNWNKFKAQCVMDKITLQDAVNDIILKAIKEKN